jgi:hypothetical protein
VCSPVFGAMGPLSDKETTPSTFLALYNNGMSGNTTISIEEGWLVGRSPSWFQTRNDAPDRLALGKFLRSSESQKPNLDAIAALAIAMPSGSAFNSAINVYFLLHKNESGQSGRNDYELLRLHGSLTHEQRRTAIEQGIPFARLTPWQKKQIEAMIFAEESLSMNWDFRGQTDEPEGPHASIWFQPTERYLNGIPQDALLKIRDDSSRRVRVLGNIQGRSVTMMEATEKNLSQILLSKERPEIKFFGGEQGWEHFSVFDQSAFAYSLQTEPRLSYMGRIHFVDSESKPVDSIEKLPPEIVERVMAQLAKLREEYKSYRPPP